MLRDPAQSKVGKAGRRGGKTVWLIAELGETCVQDGGLLGWGGPNFPILRDAYRDVVAEFGPWIVRDTDSESPWVIEFQSGGRAEFWSMDQHVVARSRKYHKFIIDEAGVIPNLELRFSQEIEPTLGDFNGKLVVGSTPNAVSPDFSKWFKLGQIPGSGWKSWKWTSLDNPAVAENIAKKIAGARARGVPEWIIRQEYFAEESESDLGFFRISDINNHKSLHAHEHIAAGTLGTVVLDLFEREAIVSNRKVDRLSWVDDPAGPWRWWHWWDGHRPPQDRAYCMGVDLSFGVGSSNTVFSVADADAREKIAQFTCPSVTPEEAAFLCAMMGYWLGGRLRSALVVPEINGPGEVFVKHMQRLRYGNLFHEHHLPSAVESNDPGRVGFRSTQTAKELLLGEYRAALATSRFVNHCEEALDECLRYQVDDKGSVISPQDQQRKLGAGGAARVPHGDMVIADGLCWLGVQQIGRQAPPDVPALPGTLAHVLKTQEDRRIAKERW